MDAKKVSELLSQYENIAKLDILTSGLSGTDDGRLNRTLREKYEEIRKREGDEVYGVAFQFYTISGFMGQLATEKQKDCVTKAQSNLGNYISKLRGWKPERLFQVVSMISEATNEALCEMRLPL